MVKLRVNEHGMYTPYSLHLSKSENRYTDDYVLEDSSLGGLCCSVSRLLVLMLPMVRYREGIRIVSS